ncbi:MAG: hypothetical protein Pg6B_00920 [Candidatus Azobacteroides pseudotrichonymphae]|nr:MAG: hypothetical protein Pg6B_00920 [Candidatus Azobacteroides pseudotrichonymphae]
MGSGTTAITDLKSKMEFVRYDISKGLCKPCK